MFVLENQGEHFSYIWRNSLKPSLRNHWAIWGHRNRDFWPLKSYLLLLKGTLVPNIRNKCHPKGVPEPLSGVPVGQGLLTVGPAPWANQPAVAVTDLIIPLPCLIVVIRYPQCCQWATNHKSPFKIHRGLFSLELFIGCSRWKRTDCWHWMLGEQNQ